MKPVLVVIGGVVIVSLVAALLRSRTAPTYHVGVADIPKVLASLSGASSSPTFAVFMFNTPDRPGDVVNLQFSLEGGRPGLDWVLLGERNIEDEARFQDFARAAGFRPKLEEANGVRYLRIEHGDLAVLCRDVVTKMYARGEAEPIELIVEGFHWKP